MEYLIVSVLVLLSGLFSGLTLGMFSLNLTALERKIRLGSREAKRIYPIRKNGNLLLCTLLLGNVAVNSAMAVFLGSIATGFTAGLISTGLIVIFGEILPQAVFSRFALKLGAKTVWIVRVFLILLYPITRPLSWLLDKLLGRELPTIWSKREIGEIIRVHEDSPHSSIDKDEERIMLGALSFSERTASDIMTPKRVAFCVKSGFVLDRDGLHKLREKGFSRVPVYGRGRDDMLGVLLVKELIGLDAAEEKSAGELMHKKRLIRVKGSIPLDRLLQHFTKQKAHLATVFDDYGAFLGIATLEDVLEEILKMEIVDESDRAADMRELARGSLEEELLE